MPWAYALPGLGYGMVCRRPMGRSVPVTMGGVALWGGALWARCSRRAAGA